MARMSIDDMFLRDPRIARLARVMSVSKFDARGRVLEVIGIVYDRIDDVLSESDIDIAAEIDGFTKHMVECDLAVPVRGKFRIRGATERIQYLRSREESGRIGGLKSGESRRNKTKVQAKVTFEANEAPLNPPDPVDPSAPDPAEDKARSEKNSAAPSAGGSRSRKAKPSEPTDAERDSAFVILAKLTARNGVKYSGSPTHVNLITARIRDGVTEADMRKIIGYCAVEKRWQGNEDMEQYLQPETLFGPKTIHRYLDPARSWFEKQGWELDAEQPRLELVP